MPGSDLGESGHLCCCEAAGTHDGLCCVLQLSPLASFSLCSDIGKWSIVGWITGLQFLLPFCLDVNIGSLTTRETLRYWSESREGQ